jgi:WD40 repeat protein/DNA-binding SARP family transcriptional activator
MRFGVLGPLEVRAGGEPIAIKGVKERRLLGLLLSRANSVVPVDSIFEALWGTEPPPSAAKSVQVYAVRLRKMLEPNGRPAEGSLISRRGAGYMLRAARDQVDALRFADRVARAREAAAAGAGDIAAQVLCEALGLWRGSAYADFQDTLFGAAEAARLEEMRQAAVEARIDADLALGRHAEVIAELEGLVRKHPLRERLWAQLMIAFYRGGRQSDALLAFRRARGGLVEEIGVEPGPELQALETAVLAHDPGLAAPDPRSLGPPELPAELRGIGPAFIGRDAALACLRGFWADAERGRGGVVLVSGPAGSGRTRLAAELAHHAHGRGAAVQVAGEHSGPEGGQASPADLVRSAAGRPVLLVLDDVDQSGPAAVVLLEAAAEAAPRLRLLVVATYGPERADARLHTLERAAGRARRLALPPLDAADAALIVERYLGSRAEPGVVRDIVAHGAGLPGRLHELAAAWVEADAAQRVAGAVGQAPAARQALSAVRATAREGLLDLYRARQERAAHTGASAPEGEGVLCPYKGLARFEKEDAAIFHGREALVATLVARLADTPLVVVVGPSGAGKSSLVRAGLLPALAAGALPGSGKWPQHVLSPGATPRRELAPVLYGRQATATAMVVVVDQFEELFTACGDEGKRAGFVTELLGLLEPGSGPARVILAVRADYLGWCAQYQELASRVADGAVLVGPMSDDEARRAVEEPARYAGLEVEPDLLDAVVDDVRGRPGSLPLLSTALLDTWERRRGRALTHAGYLAAGGVSGALARLADSAYARLAPAEQEAARRILVRLADTGEAGLPVRRRVPLAEVAAPGDQAARCALDVLVARRLLTAGDDTVEVAHEALLSHWPQLARWLEEDEQGRALRRHLAPAAREWAQSGRPDAELYRGARLASALDWAGGHAGDLNAVEEEFLAAGRAAADSELREQRERADREARARAQEAQARVREARAGRRLRVVLAGVMVLLLFSAVAGVLAVQQRSQARVAQHSAEAAQRSSEARRLGARALTEADLDRSLLLAAAAVRTDPSLETEGDLFTALQSSPHALNQVRFGGDGLLGVAVSPDGHTLAASGANGKLVFWDTRTMHGIGDPVQIGALSGGIAFSPDGRRVAVLTVNTNDFSLEVAVWDLARRSMWRHLPLPGNFNASAASLTWTRDGRAVAVESGIGSVILYDVATMTQTQSVGVPGAGPGKPVHVYAAGDDILAIAESTRDAILVDPRTAHIVRRITLPVAADSRVAVSRDGHTLAVSGSKGAVYFEDLRSGQVRSATGEHAGGAANIVLSPNGQTAASLHPGGAVTIWDVRTGQSRFTLAGHSGSVTDGAFTPDGRTLYTASLDTSVIAWDIAGNRSFGVTRPSTAQGPFSAGDLGSSYAGWSANRGRAVIGFQTGLIVTIDTATGTRTTRGRPVKGLEHLAMSPDGHYAYLSSTGPLIRRWNTTTGQVDRASTLGDPYPKAVLGVSPDGRRLVACESPSGISAACYFADAATLERVGHGITLDFSPGTAAFSPDGRLVALGNSFDQGFSVLTVPNGRITWTKSWLAGVRVIGFSADGHRLAVGSDHGQIATFDVASGRLLAGPVVAQSGPVLTASFAPDGRTILTSGADGTIRLWEAAHLHPVAEPLHLLPDEGVFAAYTPDGKEVLGLDPTGRVTAWPATVAAWLSRACSIAHRDFTPQERTLYSITPADAKPCP